MYNDILKDIKTFMEDEFAPDWVIKVAGTSEPRRDAELPFVYITPMNIRSGMIPIGHETASGHGEAQEWPITMSFIVRRGVIVNGKSEAELLRDVSETMYKLARNIEEDISSYFPLSIDYIRYVYVGGITTTLYNVETEQFRIDADMRIEFNITR